MENMELGAIERELRDIWTELSTLLKVMVETSPAYHDQLNDLRTEIANLKADSFRIQGIEETLQQLKRHPTIERRLEVVVTLALLSLEFERFRLITAQRQQRVEETVQLLSYEFERFGELTVQRLQGIEERFHHLGYEFQFLRDITLSRLDDMDFNVVNNDMAARHYNKKLSRMCEKLWAMQPIITESWHRLQIMADTNEQLNAAQEETVILQGI